MNRHLDQAPCLYFSFADDGDIIEANNFFIDTLGYTREEVAGKKVNDLFTLATRIFHQTHLFPLLRMQGHAAEIFITLLSKAGEHIPVLINAERKLLDEAQLTLLTGIVVNNRKKYEDELIAAKKAAETALNENSALIQVKQELQKSVEQLDNQMQLVKKQNDELRQFNKVVTHDLQEPLRKLAMFTSILVKDIDEDKGVLLKKIDRVAEQMRTTVAGLQQYVWLTEARRVIADVDLNALIETVHKKLENDVPGVTIHLNKEALPLVQADFKQFEILFYELLSNCARFKKSDHEAYVNITADAIQLNQFKNIEGKYKYANFLKLQVSDNGIGFDNAYKDDVFELYKRLHAQSGRGVGLSLCKKIISHHHGTITINSKEDEGTTVTIIIPIEAVQD